MNATQLLLWSSIAPVQSLYVAQSKKEAVKKTKSGLLSSKLNSLSEIAATTSSFGIVPYASSVALAAKALSKIVAKFGYSKSTTLEVPQLYVGANLNTATSSGVDLCTKLSLNGDASVAKSHRNYGDMMDFDEISNYVRNPSLLWKFTFSNADAAGDRLYQFPVYPRMSYVTDATNPEISNQEFVARLHRFWRGGMKYSIEIVGANNVTCRLRVAWTPNAAPDPIGESDGKIISEVFLVRGRAVLNFTVPYSSTNAALKCDRETTDAIFASENAQQEYFNGWISIYVVDPIVVGSEQSTTALWALGWFACAEDTVFYGLSSTFNGNYAKPKPVTLVPGDVSAERNPSEKALKVEGSTRGKKYVAQADTTTTAIVPTPTESSPLTTFADVIVPEEVKDMYRADLQIPFFPYNDVTPKQILEQMYKVHEFNWSGSSTSNTLLHTLDFPWLLMQKTYIAAILANYNDVKADIRVKFALNSTEFHAGTLVVTTLPYYNARHPWLDKMRTMSQACSLPSKYILEAGTDRSVEFVIPFTSSYQSWNQTFAPHDDASDSWAGVLGAMRTWVLSPLTLSNSPNVPTIPVTIFAKFENIVVANPRPVPFSYAAVSAYSKKYVAQAAKYEPDVTKRFQQTFPALIPASSVFLDNDIFGEVSDRFSQILSRYFYYGTINLQAATNWGDFTQKVVFNPWFTLVADYADEFPAGEPFGSDLKSADFWTFCWIMSAFRFHRGSLRFIFVPQYAGDLEVSLAESYISDHGDFYHCSVDGSIRTIGSSTGYISVELPHTISQLYYEADFASLDVLSRPNTWPVIQLRNLRTAAQRVLVYISVGEDFSHGCPALNCGSAVGVV